MRRLGVFVAALLLLSVLGQLVAGWGTSDNEPKPRVEPRVSAGETEVERLAGVLVAALDRACPGLEVYADDLTFEGVEDNFTVADGDAQRIGIIYRVADAPEVIPGRFLASGHRCHFELSRDASRLMIAKSACVRVCKASADFEQDLIEVLANQE